jgi:hypothetical protein
MNLKEGIDQIHSGKMNLDELSRFIKTGSPFERINAIKQAAKQFPSESVVLLESAAQDPQNEIELLGRTIKAIAISSLLAMKRQDGNDAARRIICTLSTNETQDLNRHLRSEGLEVPLS